MGFSVTRAYGHHVGSLDKVCSTPVTSFAELGGEIWRPGIPGCHLDDG